jgi:hypothetical protein
MISVANTSTVNPLLFKNGFDFKSLSIPSQSQSRPIVISLQNTDFVSSKKNHPRFEIAFSDFEHKFSFEIIKIDNDSNSNEIYLLLKSEDNVIKVTLSGTDKNGEGLIIDNYGFTVEKEGETPLSVFLLKTLLAILGLSSKINIKIPILNQEASMSFNTNLKEISALLQERQIAHRLMIIEKALGIYLPFPKKFIAGEDIQNITFCYYAIIQREFDWYCNELTVNPTATEDNQNLLPNTDSTFPLKFPTLNEERLVFGELLSLGRFIIEINQAKATNYTEAKENLLKLNGKSVEIIIKPANGIMRYVSGNTPTLPKNAFSKDIQALIDLDAKLDSMVMDKYFDLAGATLDGLTQEQIKVITERPRLDEEAFDF